MTQPTENPPALVSKSWNHRCAAVCVRSLFVMSLCLSSDLPCVGHPLGLLFLTILCLSPSKFCCHSFPPGGAPDPGCLCSETGKRMDGLPACLALMGPLLRHAPGRSEESAEDLLQCQPCPGMDRRSRRGAMYSRASTLTPRALLEPGKVGGPDPLTSLTFPKASQS